MSKDIKPAVTLGALHKKYNVKWADALELAKDFEPLYSSGRFKFFDASLEQKFVEFDALRTAKREALRKVVREAAQAALQPATAQPTKLDTITEALAKLQVTMDLILEAVTRPQTHA